MLTRESKKVLNELKSFTCNTEAEFAYLGFTTCFCLSADNSKTYDYQKYQGEISGIMRLLISEGYVVNTWNEYHFQLTQKALHPYQEKWHASKEFFFQSVLTPIVVSIVTTLLTLLITWLITR